MSLVAWCHAAQELAPATTRMLPNFGIYGIDIFFVISGFIMSTIVMSSAPEPGMGSAWGFMKRRLIRIYPIGLLNCWPPHVSCTAISFFG